MTMNFIGQTKYKYGVSMTAFLNKLMYVFTKDTFNWSKVTVNNFTLLQKNIYFK